MASFAQPSVDNNIEHEAPSPDALSWPLSCLCQEHASWEEALESCRALPESSDVLVVSGSITRTRDASLAGDLVALGHAQRTDLQTLVAGSRSVTVVSTTEHAPTTEFGRSLVMDGDQFAVGLSIAQTRLGASCKTMQWPAALSDDGRLAAFCFYDTSACKWFSVVVDTQLPTLSVGQDAPAHEVLSSAANCQDDCVGLMHKALLAWQPRRKWSVVDVVVALTGALVKVKALSAKTDVAALLQHPPSACHVAILAPTPSTSGAVLRLSDKDGQACVQIDTVSVATATEQQQNAQDLVDGVARLSLGLVDGHDLLELGYDTVHLVYLVGQCPQSSQSHSGVFNRASRDSGDVPSDSDDEDSEAEYEDAPQFVVTTSTEDQAVVVAEMRVQDWANTTADGQAVAAPRIGLDVFGMEAEDYEMCDDPRALWGPLTRCAFAPPTSREQVTVSFEVKDSWVYTLVPFSSIGNLSFVVRFASDVPVTVHDVVKDAEFGEDSSYDDEDEDDSDDSENDTE